MRVAFQVWMFVCVIGVLAAGARAQIEPTRVYYGLKRPMPMQIKGAGPDSRPDSLRLLAPGDGDALPRELGRAGIPAGESKTIDVAGAFPILWDADLARVAYLQAYRGDEPIGPAVVLQPLLAPTYAPRVDRDGAPAFVVPGISGRGFSGYRAFVDKLVVIETSKGAMTIALRPDAAPNTAWNFRELVEGGFYTDIRVHRVASLSARAEPDVVQFGDPTFLGPDAKEAAAATLERAARPEVSPKPAAAPGRGCAGFYVDLEPSTLKHEFGVLSLARSSDPNSGSSQVVIALNRDRCAVLDGRYASFAEVVGGVDAMAAIAHTPVDADYRTIDPPVIVSAKLLDAPPYPKRPHRVIDPATRPVER